MNSITVFIMLLHGETKKTQKSILCYSSCNTTFYMLYRLTIIFNWYNRIDKRVIKKTL